MSREASSPSGELPSTERTSPVSRGIDGKSAREICEIIHREDERPWRAVGAATPAIAAVVDRVVDAFRSGGRLLYVGAGTSGRLGVLDAAECPPTFGVPPELVQGIIAGGETALRLAVEGAEDSATRGAGDLRALAVSERDVVCGITASGSTPYVVGALEEAADRGGATVLITCNPLWRRGTRDARIDFPIVLDVGPEIIAGSSRMKAGTATKMALNMITTAAMIRWGKVYDNLMVDLKATNQKLRRRAARIVSRIAQVDEGAARALLEDADWNVRVAVVMSRRSQSAEAARETLARHGGGLRAAITDPAS